MLYTQTDISRVALSHGELETLLTEARCAGNAEMWFSYAPKKRKAAIKICETQCPVKSLCYRYALSQPPQVLAFGIWAGLETEQLQKAHKKVRR